MKKTTRNRLIITSTLIALLLGTKVKIDKDLSSLEKKIVTNSKTRVEDHVNLVAHRGYSDMYPDNTLESISACTELQCVEGIECDVRLTKDNKLVLMHNEFIGFRPVYDFTYEELCKMDLIDSLGARITAFKGYNFMEQGILAKRYNDIKTSTYTLCTIEDVLRVRDKSKLLFIDIKFSGYNDDYLIAKLGELLSGEENIIIQSFNANKLAIMHELYPEYTYQLLVDTKSVLKSIDYTFDGYGIKYNVLEEDTVEDLTKHERIVSLWTVDSYKDFNSLLEQYNEYEDIYYITNNPDILSYQLLKNKTN